MQRKAPIQRKSNETQIDGMLNIDGTGKTKIKIPPGSQTGKVFRLKGQGVTHLKRNGRGDQIILLVVVTPETLNDKQRQLLKEFSSKVVLDITLF